MELTRENLKFEIGAYSRIYGIRSLYCLMFELFSEGKIHVKEWFVIIIVMDICSG